ncbi:VOC family protein [Hymenobacter sp. BT175]|uniref:VOC family protein n=1 Tax=Hymenobacter translucens TaxID=2886507 RepID=UPI001D0F162B|nr:VOC family protein [Hymenobacter translucens]MCC2546960.1 VOC family protein [Hymenobacter translucens]
MLTHLGTVSLLVSDYDEAIAYYCGVLGFALLEDTDLGAGKRWVRVAPGPDAATSLLLAQATTAEQKAAVGRQGGGRVWLFLHTNDFARDYAALRGRGVTFLEEPRHESYGSVVVFQDCYGNKWDLLELRQL